jgi:hypothetical protein
MTQRQAKTIVRDPQAHIDALVKAGVLGVAPGINLHVVHTAYAVLPPHTHDWCYRPRDDGSPEVIIACTHDDCDAWFPVPQGEDQYEGPVPEEFGT